MSTVERARRYVIECVSGTGQQTVQRIPLKMLRATLGTLCSNGLDGVFVVG